MGAFNIRFLKVRELARKVHVIDGESYFEIKPETAHIDVYRTNKAELLINHYRLGM